MWKEVFVKVSSGYERSNKAGVAFVVKPKKSLYGLCQSPKNRFGTIDQYLGDIGCRPLKSDLCVYI